MRDEIHPASFRDPSGHLFTREGVLFRQINRGFIDEYARLMDSGLYARLTESNALVKHTEAGKTDAGDLLLLPERIPFISYPYEWSFTQLKDCALLTLEIQQQAMACGLTLKDASAYNIQFLRGRPILIDTLSFERYKAGRPWEAYRQFCQHFLAPLALMAYRDVRLGQLLRNYIDGIPLDLASVLLPAWTKLSFGILTHIHLHAGAQRRYAGKSVDADTMNMGKSAMIGLLESLKQAVDRLAWKPTGTEWAEYYDHTNYTEQAFEFKRDSVDRWVGDKGPGTIWDMGANTGTFSRAAAGRGSNVISFDVDPGAVELNYLAVKKRREERVLPLLLDLTNPSPMQGWAHQERYSLAGRGPAEMVLALAVLHHLAISNNLPLDRIAGFLSTVGKWLVVEFVPKTDTQVRKLLASRADIFPNYTRPGFEAAFSDRFEIERCEQIPGSERILYLMKSR